MSNFANTQKPLINETDTGTDYFFKNSTSFKSNKFGDIANNKLIKKDAGQGPKFYLGSYVHIAK